MRGLGVLLALMAGLGLSACSSTSAPSTTVSFAQIGALTSIQCHASRCIAVGGAGTLATYRLAVVDSDNEGQRWQRVQLPAGLAGPGEFGGLSCPTARTCLAVGYSGTLPKVRALVAQTTDAGRHWRRITAPAQLSELVAISCAQVARCEAVGIKDDAVASSVVATEDGGTHWVDQVVPDGAAIDRVDCPSVDRCLAVGTATFATSDGGLHWVLGPMLATVPSFGGVSCPSATTCFSSTSTGMAIQVLWLPITGGVGTVVDTVPLGPGAATNAGDLACGDEGCLVVAQRALNQAVVLAPARATTGVVGTAGRYRVLAATHGLSLLAVSCASQIRCVAVGSSALGAPVALVVNVGAGTTLRGRFAS